MRRQFALAAFAIATLVLTNATTAEAGHKANPKLTKCACAELSVDMSARRKVVKINVVKAKAKYHHVNKKRLRTYAQWKVRNQRAFTQNDAYPQSTSFGGGGLFGNSLVTTARSYVGTNPTGRRSLWCGAFMDYVLKQTGHKGGGNLASAYARYGTRIAGPQVGALAIMGRRGGGHVGVVSGIDPNGNPVIISGNTWSRESGGRHTVLEHAYPKGRVYAYVLPTG